MLEPSYAPGPTTGEGWEDVRKDNHSRLASLNSASLTCQIPRPVWSWATRRPCPERAIMTPVLTSGEQSEHPGSGEVEPLLISVLIVTWNRKDDVLETIQSVYEQAYHNFEIVVVDNGSTDGTVEAVRQAYAEVRIVALDRNRGISTGRNAGVAAARGDIIFCLDSDASPSHDALSNLVRKFQAEPDVGVINSKILNTYTTELDGGPGWVYTEKQKAKQDMEFLSWSFSEGGAAIRKEVFDQVGLFWDLLFFGCEGQEFSLRVWDAGYKVLYYPKAIVYHRESPRMRIDAHERDYLFFRNSLYIYLVRYPWWMLVWYMPIKTAAALARGAKRGYLRQILRALLDVLRQLPTLRKQRRPISNRTAYLQLKLQRQHGPLNWGLVSWFRHKA
jgi:N-acetylglucosaminyl-diphospho-decaprenol L-rhamnosyltransferase